jgi:hypothetical protein
MALEEFDDAQGAFLLLFHADLEGPRGALDQPGGIRIGVGAQDGAHDLGLADQRGAAHGDACHHIRVAGEELGG